MLLYSWNEVGIMDRIVIHIDVNNAFLSWTAVEMLKNGSKIDIRNRYAIIGGDEQARRGIVLAKSNPCKQKGVVTAETIYIARRKCPYLEVYKPDYELYKRYSNLMYNYLLQYTNIIERYSIDECFLEYTDIQKLNGDPVEFAYKIKDDIYKLFGFTVNVGVANNKLCAKMASDFSKPNKVHTLFKNEIESKLWPLPISDLFMIGKKTSKKLIDLNIKTVNDLAHTDLNFLEKQFKSMGLMMYNYANGIDNSKVEYEYENPKSISTSTVLAYNYSNKNQIYQVLKELSFETGSRLRKKKMYASSIGVWIKYSDFSKVSKQIKLDNSTNLNEDIYRIAISLFDKLWNEESIRALCVKVADLSENKKTQLSIFDNNLNKNNDRLQKTIDEIKDKYGDNLILYADDLINKRN